MVLLLTKRDLNERGKNVTLEALSLVDVHAHTYRSALFADTVLFLDNNPAPCQSSRFKVLKTRNGNDHFSIYDANELRQYIARQVV